MRANECKRVPAVVRVNALASECEQVLATASECE